MKKIILVILFFIFQVSYSNAQKWDSLGAGITRGSSGYNYVITVGVYNSDLYVGGDFGLAGNITARCVAQWPGANWDSVGAGVIVSSGGSFGVYSEVVYNGNLYFGGDFYETSIKGNNIAQWNGVKWDSVGSGVNGNYPLGNYGYVRALRVFNGNLYAGGLFDTAGGKPINGIAQWNGTNWDSVSSGTLGTINALCVYNGELYAGGSFDTIGHIAAKNIAVWNGTNWSTVSLGIDSTVNSLSVYNGNLYVGGGFKLAGGIPAKNIAMWNGTNWSSVGGGISGPIYTSVYALCVYGSILCAGGYFDTAGTQSANNIAYWNGTNWNPLGSGISGSAYALTTYNGTLIAGGYFDTAGGVAANNIAQWTSPLGINELANNNGNLKVYPNPNNGIFTIALSHAELVSASQTIVEIYNVMGQKVNVETLNQAQGDNLINLTGQPSGVYFYRVLQEDGSLVGEGKIVIEK